MINPQTFLFENSPTGVATITLNRPERLNALTFEVYRELTDTFAALANEDERACGSYYGRRPSFLFGRRRARHHWRTLQMRHGRFARVYADDVRACPKHPEPSEAGDRQSQWNDGRSRGVHRACF